MILADMENQAYTQSHCSDIMDDPIVILKGIITDVMMVMLCM